MSGDLTAQFWSRVTKSDNCWMWTGRLRDGYGRFTLDGRPQTAHVLTWTDRYGPVPSGMVLDHLCHDSTCTLSKDCPHRRCVNPDHLKPTSERDNILRGASFSAINSAKEACIHGHAFDDLNTYWDKRGKRQCRACNAESQRRYMARRRAS